MEEKDNEIKQEEMDPEEKKEMNADES